HTTAPSIPACCNASRVRICRHAATNTTEPQPAPRRQRAAIVLHGIGKHAPVPKTTVPRLQGPLLLPEARVLIDVRVGGVDRVHEAQLLGANVGLITGVKLGHLRSQTSLSLGPVELQAALDGIGNGCVAEATAN